MEHAAVWDGSLSRVLRNKTIWNLLGQSNTLNTHKSGVMLALSQVVGAIGVAITCKLEEALESADVVIEFSKPEATVQHLQQVVDADKAMVIATTGYTADELATINELAAQIRCVMAPNMSLGVNVMIQALELIAKASETITILR